jgi:tetratricopeptide (TPR) repeat protein
MTLEPRNAKINVKAGNILQGQGSLDEALDAYRRATNADSKLPDGHIGVGDILRAKGDSLGALVAYRQAIQSQPQNPIAHHRAGLALQDRNRKEEAIAEFRTARQLYLSQGQGQSEDFRKLSALLQGLGG